MTPSMTPELIADYACHIGENPLWHPLEHKLYWTDIPTGRLFCFDPESNQQQQVYEGRTVGGFTFQVEGGLLLFMDRGTIATWKDGELSVILPCLPDELDSRFNDVFADSEGRVFCGTMSTATRKGRLYRLDPDGSLHLLLEGVGCSNGMAMSRDRKTFYHTDSFAREIYKFDYDEASGALSNRTVFATLNQEDGLPDGATIDSEGHIWSAMWDGSCIVRLSENGIIAERYLLPVLKVTSLTFGGEGLHDLYVSTAGGDDKSLNGPLSGALFRFKSTYAGFRENFSRINTSSVVISQE